jgi:hypothetical protein
MSTLFTLSFLRDIHNKWLKCSFHVWYTEPAYHAQTSSLFLVVVIKAALFQIHAHFYEKFKNVLKCIFGLTKKMLISSDMVLKNRVGR